jgi:WD40 repeat protein
VAFGEDCLATTDDAGAVELRDVRSGRVLRKLSGHKGAVVALAFSPDGKRLASAAADGTIRLWDPASSANVRVLKLLEQAHPTWLAFQPKGHYLCSGGLRTGAIGGMSTVVWDCEGGTAVAATGGAHASGCFLPDGSAALLGHVSGSVWLSSVADVEQKRKAAQGKVEAGAEVGHVGVTPTRAVVPGGHQEGIWGVAASPDGRWVGTAAHDGSVKVWEARTMRLVHTLEGHSAIAWCVAFSPDSKRLASGGDDVFLWDVASGRELHRFDGHKAMVSSVAFHPTEPWLASSSLDGSVRLWDHNAAKPLGELHHFGGFVRCLAFRPDGRWLAATCHDHRVALWDFGERDGAATPRPPDRLLRGHTSAVCSVGFSADGRYLASGAGEGVVILWDGGTFERVVALEGGGGEIRSVCFSRDGGLLGCGAFGPGPPGAARHSVWDLERLRASLREMDLDW